MTATAREGESTVVDPSAAPRLVGCVLTLNEERNIARAVRSMQAVADITFVVDSHSTDRTREIAEAEGAVVVEHAFEGYAAQRNWALAEIERRWGGAAWAFTLDADEWLSDELGAELAGIAASGRDDADIYIVPVRRRFDGRVLKHGGFGRTWSIRMWRAGYSAYGERAANETLVVPDDARIVYLDGWLEHADVDSWEKYIAKHNHYSTVEADARRRARDEGQQRVSFGQAVRDRSVRRRFLRQRVWDLLPDSAKPALRFVQVYVVSLGFLDRRAGFERALFEAWQEMCTDLKAREAEAARADAATAGAPS